jgi:hypothetical protein
LKASRSLCPCTGENPAKAENCILHCCGAHRTDTVCLDESLKQLIAETRVPIPAKPGHPARHDYEYERNGTANLFMMFAPLEGWRHVEVTDRHTAVDYAHILKQLSDKHFPDRKKSH